MDNSKSFSKTVLERAKAKDLTEAEILLQKYKEELLTSSKGITHREQKARQAALSIIDSGIFWRGELKGRKLRVAGKGVRYQTYPIHSPRNFIKQLVEEYLAAIPHPDDSEWIIEAFDNSFNSIADVALYAGIPLRQVRKVWQAWREKLADKVRKEGPPRRRQSWEEPGDTLSPLFHRLLHSLLFAAPKAPNNRIVEWVIAIMTALGEQPLSDRTLRNYIRRLRAGVKEIFPGGYAGFITDEEAKRLKKTNLKENT